MRISFNVLIETCYIAEAELASKGKHLEFGIMQFLETDLVDFLRGQTGCCHPADLVTIAGVAIRQGPDARLNAPLWCIFVAHKDCEALVSRDDFAGDHRQNCLTQSLLVGRRNP